jgi:hypothetical protein
MLDDDRLIALVGALIVENSLETYLSASLLGYKKELSGSKDFFFSWKIAVAKSLRFCPNKILTCADVIRQLRNEFAHNLGIRDFVYQKGLDYAFLSIVDETPRKERTMREKFVLLSINTAEALFVYTKDVQLLNSFLRSDSFHSSLLKFAENGS